MPPGKPHRRLRGPLLKIKRANKHIRELNRVHDSFTAKHYPLLIERDPKTGEKVVRITQKRKLPARWSVIVGDVLFNLRSALDHLACQLVIVGSDESRVTNETGFPITRNPQVLKPTSPKVEGMCKDAIRRINALKPYKGGNDALWTLHRLNIIDKHKLLLLMNAIHQGTVIHDETIAPLFGGVLPLVPVRKPRPLQHGDELARHRRRSKKSNRKVQFLLAVTLWDTEVAHAEPVVPLLVQLSNYVEGLVYAFEDLLD